MTEETMRATLKNIATQKELNGSTAMWMAAQAREAVGLPPVDDEELDNVG